MVVTSTSVVTKQIFWRKKKQIFSMDSQVNILYKYTWHVVTAAAADFWCAGIFVRTLLISS